MKKFLWILFIVLLLGVGFLYVVKNPTLPLSQTILTTLGIELKGNATWTVVNLTNCESYFDGCNTCMVSSWVIGWCTKMFCQTPAEPQCLQYTWTGMDLSGCVSYFDGCNTCSVKDGRPDACTEMYCETHSQPKCNQYGTGNELTGSDEATGVIIDQNNSSLEETIVDSIPTEFTYTKQDDIDVIKSEHRILDFYTAESLVWNSSECGINKSLQYFQDLLSKINQDKIIQYHFILNNKQPSKDWNESTDTNWNPQLWWKVTIVPNKMWYKTIEEVKIDFPICRAWASMIPLLVSDTYILFFDGCWSGAWEPFGCSDIQSRIQKNIQLK